MTFSLYDNVQPNVCFDSGHVGESETVWRSRDEFHFLEGKLLVPSVQGNIHRPRLAELLTRSRNRYPATLITGRAGTGKTAFAAAFAATVERVSWYSVEATDADWSVFSRYFSESLTRSRIAVPANDSEAVVGYGSQQDAVPLFLLRHFFRTPAEAAQSAPLIVLDNIHHLFDADWFEDFFYLLIHSLPQDAHLLLLCRSKPPAPMWRMRSKQLLNVLDEKEIAFDADETKNLFRSLGLPITNAENARRKSFGRISKLLQIVRSENH